MLKKISTNIKTALCAVMIAVMWSSLAVAIDTTSGPNGSPTTLPFYRQLNQNIESEAALYSDYSVYQERLRVQIFWDQLEQLNLSRDEIIQTIAMLEKRIRLEGVMSENAYNTVSGPPLLSGPYFLADTFSNWRGFYILVSGGFLLINAFLLTLAVCVTCRRNVGAFIIGNLKKMISGDHGSGNGDDAPFPDNNPLHRKAA